MSGSIGDLPMMFDTYTCYRCGAVSTAEERVPFLTEVLCAACAPHLLRDRAAEARLWGGA